MTSNTTLPLQLLDMCRRLDAMETTGFADPLEAAEVATLRVLMSVSLLCACMLLHTCSANYNLVSLLPDCLAKTPGAEQKELKTTIFRAHYIFSYSHSILSTRQM